MQLRQHTKKLLAWANNDGGNFLTTLILIIDRLLFFLSLAILFRIILSMILPSLGRQPHSWIIKLSILLASITEPILGPLRDLLREPTRKIHPIFERLDFSPMAAILLIYFIQWALHRLLIAM